MAASCRPFGRRGAVTDGADALDPCAGELSNDGPPSPQTIVCSSDRRNPVLLDARSFKSFRSGFEKPGAIAAATKPENDVHAAIRLFQGPFEAILYEKEDAAAYMTWTTPRCERAKPENDQRVRAAFEDSRDDPRIPGAIIIGAGERAFIAGGLLLFLLSLLRAEV